MVHDECSSLCSRDGHIEQAAFFSIREFVSLVENEIQHWVIAHECRKAKGILVALEQDDIIGFQSF